MTFPGVPEVTKRFAGPVVIPGFDICYLEPILKTIDFRHLSVCFTPRSLNVYFCEKLTGVFWSWVGYGRWGQDWKQAEAPGPHPYWEPF